jgi:hypothetical protein
MYYYTKTNRQGKGNVWWERERDNDREWCSLFQKKKKRNAHLVFEKFIFFPLILTRDSYK